MMNLLSIPPLDLLINSLKCFFEDISSFVEPLMPYFGLLIMSAFSGGSRIPRGGGNRKGGGANLLFDINFAENCVKMKKNWTEKKGRPWHSH